jgi:PAS domain S-box-containing protein
MKNLPEKFSDVVRKWRAAESQRTIFGIHMPQTQRAIEDLLESLQKVFESLSTFSVVRKDQAMEIVVKSDTEGSDGSSSVSIPANLPSLPKIFTDLKINSVTLNAGITPKELKEFFTGLSAKVEEIDPQGGLKGFLQKQGVSHIKVDQMKFQLLKDEERVTKGIPEELLKDGKGSKKQIADIAKLHDSVWKDYLAGKLDKGEFKNQHQDFITTACEEPKQLEKILKNMIVKQKEAEKFLAQLEHKLFEIGFPEDAILSLKKKLLAPKKILISEDELARLRKIEKEFEKNLDKRIDGELETIKVIKKKLADEAERSEAILHQMSQGGIILDKSGKILSINSTAQNILGISEDEVRGKNINDVLKSHHLLTTVSDWQSETDTHIPKEVKVQALSEETLSIIRESAIVIENENGRSIGVVSALHNVTQQEELNRRKNDILDVLGHDLRAPLGAIKQNFDVLVQSTNLSTECNDQQKKFLENCKRNIVRMGSLIEKILDMRQLETGKILLKHDAIETNKLLEEAVASLSGWAQEKHIKLEVNTQNMPNMEGDPERLYQVITNLVSNALKFTPEGGSIMVIGQSVENQGIKCIEISVKDSGIGIKTEDLKRLGLGLSICKTIVEMHGGSIWADSKLDSGSTFTFQIPFK